MSVAHSRQPRWLSDVALVSGVALMRMIAHARYLRTQLAVGEGVSPAALDLSRDGRVGPLLHGEREGEAGEADDETNECIDDVMVRGEDDGRELGPRQEESEDA